MAWNGDEDRFAHPAWCFCTACGGGGDAPAQDDELDGTADEVDTAVSFINKMVRDTTRTVWQAYRQYNHYEKEYDDMPFNVSGSSNENTNTGRVGDRKQKGLKFLDPETDLAADRRRCKILWAGDPKLANVHATWARVTVKIESASTKARRLWTLGASNPSLDVLVAGLGADADAWTNREMWMWCDKNNPSETPFVRLEIIPLDEAVQAAAATAAPAAGGNVNKDATPTRSTRNV